MADNDSDRPQVELRSSPKTDQWVYEKGDLEQGVFYLDGRDNERIAVILPLDRTQPIDVPGRNARVLLREFGSGIWQERGPYSLPEAFERGNDHSEFYHAELNSHTLLRDAGLSVDDAQECIVVDSEHAREAKLFLRRKRTPFREQPREVRAQVRRRNKERDDGYER